MFEIPKFEVDVCRGPNCERRGAEAVFDQIKEDLADMSGVVAVVRHSCFNACDKGPNVSLTENMGEGNWPKEIKFFNRIGRTGFRGRRIKDVESEIKEEVQNNSPQG